MKLYKVIFPGGNHEEFDDIEAAQRFADQHPGAMVSSPDPDRAMEEIIKANERKKHRFPPMPTDENDPAPGGPKI